MLDMFVALSLALGTFFMRLPFTLSRTGDDWVSYWMLRRQRKRYFNYEFDDGTIKSSFGYPALHYVIVSLFPKDWQTRIGILLSPIYDSLTAVGLYAGAVYVFAHELNFDPSHARTLGILVAMLWVSSPILTPTTARLSGIKTRSLGSMLHFFTFASLSYAYINESYIAYVVAFAFFCLLVVGSQMALQGVVFTIIGLAIIYLDPFFFLILLAFIVLACLVPVLGCREVLLTRWHHMRWYSKSVDHSPIKNRNRWADVFKIGTYFKNNKEKFLDLLFNNNSVLIGIFTQGVVLIGIGIFFYSAPDGYVANFVDQEYVKFGVGITLGSLVAFVVTSFRYFLFIGEAERYFDFSSPFMAFILVVGLSQSMEVGFVPTVMSLIMLQLALMFGTFLYIQRKTFKAKYAEPDQNKNLMSVGKIIHKIADRIDEVRVVVFPSKYSFQLSSLFYRDNVKYLHIWMRTKDGFDYMHKDFPEYFYPSHDIPSLMERHGVNCVVVDKGFLRNYPPFAKAIKGKTAVYQNEQFAILMLK